MVPCGSVFFLECWQKPAVQLETNAGEPGPSTNIDAANIFCLHMYRYFKAICGVGLPLFPNVNENATSELEKIQMKLLNSFILLISADKDTRQGNLLFDYQLFRGVAQFQKGKEVSSWVVLSFDMLVALQLTFSWCEEDISRGFKELKECMARVSKQISEYSSFTATFAEPFALQLRQFRDWRKSFLEELASKSDILQTEDMDKEILKGRLPQRVHLYACEENFLLKHDPIMCGLWMMDYELKLHSIGQELAGMGNMVVSAMHLYNAVLQHNFLAEKWEDMETVIAWQTDQHVFVGERPVTMSECRSHLLLALSVSASAFASDGHLRNRRTGECIKILPMNAQRCGRKLLPTSPYVQLCQQRIGLMIAHFSTSIANNLGALMHKVVEHYKPAPTAAPDEKKRLSDEMALFAQWDKHHTLTSVQLLHIIRYSMEADDSHLSFDYFELTQRCLQFLRDFRDTLCCGPWDAEYWKGDENLQILASNVLGFPNEPEDFGPLMVCATVMNGLIEREGDKGIGKSDEARDRIADRISERLMAHTKSENARSTGVKLSYKEEPDEDGKTQLWISA